MTKIRIVLLVTLLSFVSCKEDRESYVVKKQDLVEAVYSSVVIDPLQVYTVRSTITGYLAEILVEEGDLVEPGSLLFGIRDVTADRTTENARLTFQQAQKNLKSDASILADLQLEIDQLALKRKNDSLNYSRSRTLFDKQALSKIDFEQSELQFSSSKSTHQAAKNRLQRTRRELKNARDQAENNFKSSSARLSDSRISSILQGRIYEILKETGDLVTVQESIAIIGSADRFKVKLLIDELDIARIQEGQRVVIDLEAFDKLLEAKVVRIAPKMDEQTQTFEVIALFNENPEKLYMGLTGEASIVISERTNAIVIPSIYLNNQGEVETSQGRKKVKVGVRSLSQVEILEGLKAGEVIYKPEL
jgi:HlyD family secretion protein